MAFEHFLGEPATFDDLRSAVIKAFGKYMEDVTKIVSVMKKFRAEARYRMTFSNYSSEKP
jgi:hypothetical protein